MGFIAGKTRGLSIALAIVLLMGVFTAVYALSDYLAAFNTRYGTSGTVLNSCTLCHIGSPGNAVFNPYGAAFDGIGSHGSNPAGAFAAIEALDSDGDSFSNLTEINARTFPGDATSHPAGDAAAPQVTAFSIPATATSLTVSITSFTASDDVGVTGYLITETSTKPLASAAGWAATAPTSHTFGDAGSKTLYAWAKDAAGNVSNSLSAPTLITINDTNPPQVTGFSIPATGNSLVVPITAFTANDNIGVTGYLITETASSPLASAAGWSASAPMTYTFPTSGSKTLYAWAKDAVGNVSASASASTTITLTDTVRPEVTAFSVPATATSLTIAITTFTASDNTGVTGYLITETTTQPSPDPAVGWSASIPTTYTFTTAGSKTLYAWAKDAAGNVSSTAVSGSTTITIASSDDGGGGSGDCFIATAAFGSYLSPYVRVLRSFRDTFLLTNTAGRSFVAWYYRNSPPVADAIAQRSVARAIVRAGLLPLIVFSLVALKIGLLPALLAILLCLAAISLGAQRTRAARRTAHIAG